MKKIEIFSLLVLFFCAILFSSCTKKEGYLLNNLQLNEEINNLELNETTWIYSNDSKKPLFRFKIAVGHSVLECGGKCIKILGKWGHLDCVGVGDVCKNSVAASIAQSDENDDYYLTFVNANALGIFLEYPFPDRSFKITNPQNNTDLWINIPEQIVVRESEEDDFVLLNVWFSETAELENK